MEPSNDQKWRRGGMTFSGLKETTQALNYMYAPGRQNFIPNANSSLDNKIVSSIGAVQYNGTKQIGSGTSGPGTLYSTNLTVTNPIGINDTHIGVIQNSGNKTQYVDFRHTDPVLVNNLRNNPLSIYAQGDGVKSRDIPAFFADVRPENYADYVQSHGQPIDQRTKELYIDGSPQVRILGLANDNPFLGLGRPVANDKPTFSGRVYGGNDTSSASGIASALYEQDGNICQNRALSQFAQGYNIAPQILSDKIIVEGPHSNNNLPWGPVKVTGNPETQQGGIWQQGNNPDPTIYHPLGIQSNNTMGMGASTPNYTVTVDQNPYKYGLPGSLIP